MKILVGCSLPEFALNELRALGTEVLYEPNLSTERMEELVPGVAVLVVCRTRVSPEVIAAGKALQMIVRSGTDTANIAIEEASTAGVFVANCPHKDAIAIAELTFGLLLALDRRVLENAVALKRGAPPQPQAVDALGLAGRTLGVVGFGPIEQAVARRARGFEMNVLAWSPSLTPESARAAQVGFCAWPRELARQSEVVAAYVSQEKSEDVLVDSEFLENMRDGAYFVYVGHPAGLDEVALSKVARERKLRVGYDISAPQLATSDTARFRANSPFGGPHAAGSGGDSERGRACHQRVPCFRHGRQLRKPARAQSRHLATRAPAQGHGRSARRDHGAHPRRRHKRRGSLQPGIRGGASRLLYNRS
jgi:D-3-phosphoglycerate dehydrogenase